MEVEAIETDSFSPNIPPIQLDDERVHDLASRNLPLSPPNAPAFPKHPNWNVREQTRLLEIQGPELPHGRIGGMNGVGTYLEEALGYANRLNQYSGGYRIEWIFNCPYTAIADIVGLFLLKVSPPEKFLKANWTRFHEEYRNDPDAKYLQFCHSQGAVHVKKALSEMPDEIRNRIIVVAISPAAIIPKTLCFASYNYTSKRDVVPYCETIASALLNPLKVSHHVRELDELIFLSPHPDAPALDHVLSSPTFDLILEHHVQRFVKEYGLRTETAS